MVDRPMLLLSPKRHGFGWICLLAGLILMWGGCEPKQVSPDGESSGEPVKEATQEQGPAEIAPDEPAAAPDEPAVKDAPGDGSPGDGASPEPTRESAGEGGAEKGPTSQPYTIVLFDKVVINSTGKVNVRSVTTSFKFRNETFAKLALHVELRSPCYPFEQWQKPPAGHNWPANCDAFDRNMNITWNPPKADGEPPGFDLIRVITPFGGPLNAAANVTDLGNALAKKIPMGQEHQLRIQISTYSDAKGQVSGAAGSWIVSARLEVTPGTPPRNVLAAIPLFNHNYKHNDGTREKATFTLPEGTTSSKLFYTVTGHGGGTADSSCIGHADEFCRRSHQLFVDDKQVMQFVPWRSDCARFCTETPHPFNPSATYCKENPCGSKASVRAPRANWCPGSVTYPEILSPAALQSPGQHTFGYQVNNVAKGGSWRVSAILYAYGD